MILHDIPNDAVTIEIISTAFDTEVLLEIDFDRGNIVTVPGRSKDAVGEAQGQQVLDHLVAEEVVHSVDLVLAEEVRQVLWELFRGFQVATEGLFDHHSRPAAGKNKKNDNFKQYSF